MIKKLLFVVVCCLLFACSERPTALPENVLSTKKMTEILTDMQLLEASLSLDVKQASMSDEENAKLILRIFEKHQITKEQYETSLDFYTKQLDSLGKIYEDVMVELSKMQAEKDSVPTAQSDSIHQQDKQRLQRERMLRK